MKREQLLRYDNRKAITTYLDPIEDLLNLVIALQSSGYTCDLLRTVHGFTSAKEITTVSKQVKLHSSLAAELADQALSGSIRASFLPLYYSTLTLSKIFLLFANKRLQLETNRSHGARYSDRDMSRDFLKQRIEIIQRGTIPLLYSALLSGTIPKSRISVSLDEIYPFISSIGAEYELVTKKCSLLCHHEAYIVEDGDGNIYLEIRVFSEKGDIRPKPKQFKAYRGLSLKFNGTEDQWQFRSRLFSQPYDKAKNDILKVIVRPLLGDTRISNRWTTVTPVNGRKHVFSEEINILLAYFHLSNVVRYNPEHLSRLMDSKYWVMLLALRKHGFLRFLTLMWSNFQKQTFDVLTS